MNLANSIYGDLIGKPFERGGRGPHAYDCLGLAMEIMGRRGLVLPAYVSDPRELHRQMADEGETLGGLVRVQQPQGGEVVLFRSLTQSYPCHMGVMINPWHMVHTTSDAGCVVARVMEWRRRLLGYYQAEGLA